MKHATYNLLLTGFKTPEQARAFIDWYASSGEQDSRIWFEARKEDGEIDVDKMRGDLSKFYKWNEEGNTLTAHIKVS
jgi:ABC-type Fe3+ transport system substrate-binding protein